MHQTGDDERSKLIITIFHTSKLDPKLAKGPDPKYAQNVNNYYLDLKRLSVRLPLIDDCDDFVDDTTTCPPHITRRILNPSQPCTIAPSAFRHDPFVAEFEAKYGAEIIFDLSRTTPSGQRPIKLAFFDMDSTLINEEVIDELARSIGISDAVSTITARAMNGDIDFGTSLQERVAMLKGVPSTVWEDLKKTVTVADGARELIAGLKERGVFTGVVSGGFTPMAEWLKEQLGLDVAIANHLLEVPPTDEFPFPHLSGRLDPKFRIVTPELKRDTLIQLAKERCIPLSETMAVGDGSNDLLMLGTAGLGIAWRAKEKVQIAAPMRLNRKSLADLMFLLGPDQAGLQDGIVNGH